MVGHLKGGFAHKKSTENNCSKILLLVHSLFGYRRLWVWDIGCL